MVPRVEEEGWTAPAVAEVFTVSERTVHKGLARYRTDRRAELQDRSSRARTVANRLAGVVSQLEFRPGQRAGTGRRMGKPGASGANLLAHERREEIAYILANQAGCRFVWRLLCETGAIATSTTADPPQAPHAEGRRSVGTALLAEEALDGIGPSFASRRAIRLPKGRQPAGCRGRPRLG